MSDSGRACARELLYGCASDCASKTSLCVDDEVLRFGDGRVALDRRVSRSY